MDTDTILARIEEVEKRANAATEGPWTVRVPWAAFSGIVSPGGPVFHTAPPDNHDPDRLEADHVFAAHARTDIPDDIADIRSLVTALEQCRSTAQKLFREHMELIPRARAAVQRATAAETLLRELIDIEGPCPGTAGWADNVRAHLSAHTPEDVQMVPVVGTVNEGEG